MKQIPLSQGKFALVDDAGFEWLNQRKWYVKKDRNSFYAYSYEKITRKKITIHGILLDVPEGLTIDHIDGNGLNNQRGNLRIVTIRQNAQNRHAEESSLYPGVSWHKRDKKWQSSIWDGRNHKHLGNFTNEHDAFCAYRQACESLGENVITSETPDRLHISRESLAGPVDATDPKRTVIEDRDPYRR